MSPHTTLLVLFSCAENLIRILLPLGVSAGHIEKTVELLPSWNSYPPPLGSIAARISATHAFCGTAQNFSAQLLSSKDGASSCIIFNHQDEN